MGPKRQDGFTLLELLVSMIIITILASLGFAALRHYWFVRSVKSAADEVAAQLSQLQSQADSVSHPVVYGAWFMPGESNSGRYGTLVYDPTIEPVSDRCQPGAVKSLPTDVRVTAATFDDTPTLTDTCRDALVIEGVAGAQQAQQAKTVFFYARGNSTGGEVTVARNGVAGARTIEVAALTGRVEEEE